MKTTVFHDYDAYAHAVDSVDARFMLKKLESPRWQLGGTCLPRGITVQHCWSGSGLIVQGAGTRDGVVFAIPAAGEYVANGTPVPIDGALLIEAQQEFLVSMRGRHRCFNVFIPHALLHGAGLDEAFEQGPGPPNQVLTARNPGARSVAALLARFVADNTTGVELASSSHALANFELGLVNAMRCAWGTQRKRTAKPSGRQPTVDKVTFLDTLDYIDAVDSPSVPLPVLAARANIPERTLRASFKKFLGLSPTQYMQLRLMHRARERLALSEPDQLTVARVAADLGFWDFGRFAQRYRQVFGELPSATLHSPRAA